MSNYKSAAFWKNCVNIQDGSYDVPEACTKTVSGTLLNDVRSGFTITSTAATTINGTTYDGTMKLSSQQAPTEAATLKIPASVSHDSKTYAVTEIDGKVIYETMSYPLTVALGENIKSIGNMAFNNQPYITGLTLNKNLQKSVPTLSIIAELKTDSSCPTALNMCKLPRLQAIRFRLSKFLHRSPTLAMMR